MEKTHFKINHSVNHFIFKKNNNNGLKNFQKVIKLIILERLLMVKIFGYQLKFVKILLIQVD